MKIAIVKLSALGDIVHAMVVLQFIKKNNPEVIIDWVVDENFCELLNYHPHINKVHKVKIKNSKNKTSFFLLLSELKKVRKFGPYDAVIDMQGLIKSAIISRFIPSRLTLGFDKTSAREPLAALFYNKTFKIDYEKNVIERNIKLIDFMFNFNISDEEIYNKIPFLYSSKQYLNTNNVSISKKNILLIPGASHKSKRYPASKLANLSTLIDANFLVIWGNNEEKLLADKIKKISPSINVCNKLSINELILLISKVDLVIGPDTGPTHISWALNIPSIVLFGSTPGYRNSYATKINHIIQSNSKVNPFQIDKNDYSIQNIDVKKILKVSEELLSQ